MRFISLMSAVVLTIPLSLSAAPKEKRQYLLREIPCEQNVFEALAQWEAPSNWTRVKNAPKGTTELVSDTAKKGVKLGLRVEKDRTVQLSRQEGQSRVEVRIQASDCSGDFKVVDLDQKNLSKDVFTDQDLENFLKNGKKKNQRQIIYIWSPHMNMSIYGIGEAEKAAQEMKAELLVLLDPAADLRAAQEKAKKYGIKRKDVFRRAGSGELFARDQRLHYPVYFVAQRGNILSRPRWGHDTSMEMKTWIDRSIASEPGEVSVPADPAKGVSK